MAQSMIGFHKQAATGTAVANGIGILLPVGQTVYQAGIGRFGQNRQGVLLCDFATHTVFDDVMAEGIEMQADLHGHITDIRLGVQALPRATGTIGYGIVLPVFDDLDNVFKGHHHPRVGDGFIDR